MLLQDKNERGLTQFNFRFWRPLIFKHVMSVSVYTNVNIATFI